MARVIFVRPRLGFVITSDGRVSLVGQAEPCERPDAPRSPMTLDRVPRGHFAVTDAVLEVLDLRAKQGRFQLTHADLDVLRSGDQITLTGRVGLPEHLGSEIDIEAEASGALADNDAVAWRARVEARRLDLAGWAAMLPESFRVPETGQGSIRVSARGTGRTVTSPATVSGAHRPAPCRCHRFVHAHRRRPARTARCHHVVGRGLGAGTGEARRPWRPGSLKGRLVRKDGRIVTVAARADYLRLENIAALAAALPPGTLRDRVAAIAPRGELSGIDITVSDVGGRQLPDITGKLRFANVGLTPDGRAAGFSGFDGTLEEHGSGGIVDIATREATLDWPQQWWRPCRSRVPMDVAAGSASTPARGSGSTTWLRTAATALLAGSCACCCDPASRR